MPNDPFARTVGFLAGERNVFFHLLTACNLRCRHCYINPAQHGNATLDLNTVLRWLKLFARLREETRKTNLILLGGEPTLHPDLAAIIRAAKGMAFSVTVDSNGYLFHDLLDRVGPEELDFLSFSLDGPDAAVNDPIRGQGVFAVCTENLRKAVARGLHTSVIYTVSGLNIDHLHRMPQLLAGIGVQRFFIQVIGLRGKPGQGALEAGRWQVDPCKWLAVVPEVAAQAAALGLHTTYPKVYLDPGEPFQCAGGWRRIILSFPTAGSISAHSARITPSTPSRSGKIGWSSVPA